MSPPPEPAPAPSDDVFFCPACGQKHRGDMSSLRKGGSLRATCVACKKALAVTWSEGKPNVRVVDAEPAKAAAPAATATAKAAAPTAAAPATATKTSSAPTAAPATTAAAVPPSPPPPAKAADAKREGEVVRSRKDKAREDKGKAAEEAEPPIVAEFAPGTVVGRYTLEEAVGQGGTGTVYRAFDPTTNRYVALKFLGKDQSDAMRTRFLREIEVQANLKHPNLMPVFDRGEHEGRPYFTMELLYKPFTLTEIVEMGRDGSLSRYATLRPLEDTKALVSNVFLPICEGLHVANVENGVVHRDLKPDNVLVDSRTLRPYVIDFGICHVLERKSRTSNNVIAPTTEDAGIVGTPRFLAPEQARGTVHERTDVWGLGGILHFILTGEAPIAAASPITRLELKRRIEALRETEKAARSSGDDTKADLCADKLSRLEDVGLRTLDDLFRDAREGIYVTIPASAPPALAAIARKAMAPKTAERYVNVRSLAADVSAWLSGAQTRAQAEQGGSAAAVVHQVGRGLRRHLPTALAGVGCLLLGMLVGPSLFGGGGGMLGGASFSAESATQSLEALERRAEEVSRSASSLGIGEAARVHDLLAGDLEAQSRAIASVRGSAGETLTARAEALGARFAAHYYRISLPKGVETAVLEDVVRGTSTEVKSGADLAIRPGDYRLKVGGEGGLRIPFVVPFEWRDSGRDPGKETPRTLVVPVAPGEIPADRALVVPVGDTVDHRGPPFQAPSLPASVGPFLMDRYEVTNGEYLEFLESLKVDDERKARAPTVAFDADPDHPARFVVSSAARELPVRGITPQDAVTYCAWRSKKDGVTVRLPSEAEWAVAAGAQLKQDLPGGGRGLPDDGDFAAPVPVRSAKDRSAYGVLGMLGNVREFTTGVRTASDAPDHFLVKGGGYGGEPEEAHVRRLRPVPKDFRDERTGFRCVRELKSAEAEAPKDGG